MPNQIVSFTTPYDAAINSAMQRQKIADMLRQQAADQIPVSQVGNTAGPISWLSVLSKGLQAYGANKNAQDAQDEILKAQQADQERAQELARQLTGADNLQLQERPIPASSADVNGQQVQLPAMGGTGGTAPTPPPMQQQLAMALAAGSGPQEQAVRSAMLPQIMAQQNAERQQQFALQTKALENQLPMSEAQREQIAAQGQQTQQNAILQAQLQRMNQTLTPEALQQKIQIERASHFPTTNDILVPLMQKMQRGEKLTDGEQAVLQANKPGVISPNDPSISTVASAIANYQQPMLSGFVQKTPWGQQVMAQVYSQNPQYRAQEYNASNAAARAFTSGQQGNLVRSFNVAIQHLDVLDNLANALHNGNVQAINAAGNAAAAQLGVPAPTNFNAAKAIVGDEVIKAIVGTGGALADRQNAQNQISSANSPQQLSGVIKTYKRLMAGQLNGLKKQYESATKLNDFNSMLLPATQQELGSIEGSGGGANTPRIRVFNPVTGKLE